MIFCVNDINVQQRYHHHHQQPHLEELDSDAGKHELQQSGDDHDVSNGADGHKHTLHHMLHT